MLTQYEIAYQFMRFEESKIQQVVIKWARYSNLPLFSIPNGAHVSGSNRMRLVAEGLEKGVPDLFLPVPSKDYHGLFIEIKTPVGRTTMVQENFHKKMECLGYKVIISRGSYECIEEIEEYLKDCSTWNNT